MYDSLSEHRNSRINNLFENREAHFTIIEHVTIFHVATETTLFTVFHKNFQILLTDFIIIDFNQVGVLYQFGCLDFPETLLSIKRVDFHRFQCKFLFLLILYQVDSSIHAFTYLFNYLVIFQHSL